MGQYLYKARDPSGKMKTGKMEASSKEIVRSKLVRMQLRPITIQATKLDKSGSEGGLLSKFVSKDGKGLHLAFGDKQAGDKDIIIFSKQFAVMLKSGVPIVQSLDILSNQQRVKSFGEILGKIRHAVENGATLSETLEAYPRIFDRLYVAMVKAGEAAGNLDEILFEIIRYLEKSAKIKAQIKSAMTYPIIVFTVAIGVVTLLLVFVVPTMSSQFEQSGKELPELTQMVVNLSNFVKSSWYEMVGFVFLAGLLIRQYVRTADGRKKVDALMLRLPAFGDLLRKVAVGRFCSTLASLLTSGVNLLDALNITAAAAGNKTIEAFILKVRDRIEQGDKFSTPLSQSNIFPQMVVSMVSVGEATGALDEMLSKVSEFYEEEVDNAIKGVIALVEPVMIVGIGGIIAFIVIAMYMPVFDLGSVVGN